MQEKEAKNVKEAKRTEGNHKTHVYEEVEMKFNPKIHNN